MLGELTRPLGLAGSAPRVALLAVLSVGALAVRRDWSSVWAMVVSLGLAAGVTLMLKIVVARNRPAGAMVDSWDSHWGFPSGHAALSLTFYGLAAYIAAVTVRSRLVRHAIAAVALALVLAIGASRVFARAHDSIDVMGGYSVAVVALVTGIATRRRLAKLPSNFWRP